MESAFGKGGSVWEIAPVESITANSTSAAPSFIRLPPATLLPAPGPPAECAATPILVRLDRTTPATYVHRLLSRPRPALWLRGQVKAEYSRRWKHVAPARCS